MIHTWPWSQCASVVVVSKSIAVRVARVTMVTTVAADAADSSVVALIRQRTAAFVRRVGHPHHLMACPPAVHDNVPSIIHHKTLRSRNVTAMITDQSSPRTPLQGAATQRM